jgi:hypothetical protein
MYIAQPFLTSALDGGEWSTSRPGRFTPSERNPSTNWMGACVGPSAGLETVEKEKNLSTAVNRKFSFQPTVIQTELSHG